MGGKQSTTRVANSINEFCNQLYKYQIADSENDNCCGKNVIFSPFQLYCTLLLFYSATTGKAKLEIKTALNLDNVMLKENAVHRAIADFIRCCKLNGGDKKGVHLFGGLFASEIYRDKIQSTFTRILTNQKDVLELNFINFNNGLVNCNVESWARQCIGGLIKDPTRRFYLGAPLFHVDLFCIADELESITLSKQTSISFQNRSGHVTDVSGTYFVGKFLYIHDVTNKIRVVGIPLKYSKDFNVLIILPENREDFEKSTFKDHLNEQIGIWLDTFSTKSELEIYLPQLKTNSLTNVTEQLQYMGIRSLFEGNADFSGMVMLTPNPLFVTSLNSRIKIDITSGGANDELADENFNEYESTYTDSARVELRVDHAFMYIVVHGPTRTVFLAALIETL